MTSAISNFLNAYHESVGVFDKNDSAKPIKEGAPGTTRMPKDPNKESTRFTAKGIFSAAKDVLDESYAKVTRFKSEWLKAPFGLDQTQVKSTILTHYDYPVFIYGGYTSQGKSCTCKMPYLDADTDSNRLIQLQAGRGGSAVGSGRGSSRAGISSKTSTDMSQDIDPGNGFGGVKGMGSDEIDADPLEDLSAYDPVLEGAKNNDGSTLGFEFNPSETLQERINNRSRRVTLANEVVGTYFNMFMEKKKELDRVRKDAEQSSMQIEEKQAEVSNAINGLRKFAAKTILPIEKRFNIVLTGHQYIEEAINANNMRVVPPSCLIGSRLPLKYIGQDDDITLEKFYNDDIAGSFI